MNERDERLKLTSDELNAWWLTVGGIRQEEECNEDRWAFSTDASWHLLNTAPEQQP